MARIKLAKNFPVVMDMSTELGIDRMVNTLRNFFPKGVIPVVCPDCGTKNDVKLKDIEDHIMDRGHVPEEFDDCKKCGRDLVFDQPMGPKREPDPPRPLPQKKALEEQKTAKVEMPKRWNPKSGKWEDKKE